eukprot:735300-Rhodomonas_salina.1
MISGLNTGTHVVEEVSESSEILLEGQQETLHVLICLVHGQNCGVVGLSKQARNVGDKVPVDSFRHPLVEEEDPAKDLDTNPKPRAGFPSRKVKRSIQQILDATREENASQTLLLSVVALQFEPGLLKHQDTEVLIHDVQLLALSNGVDSLQRLVAFVVIFKSECLRLGPFARKFTIEVAELEKRDALDDITVSRLCHHPLQGLVVELRNPRFDFGLR